MSVQSTTATVQYKEIPGFPNYRIGDDGSVWSNKYGHGTPGRVLPPGQWKRLRGFTNPDGYVIVYLCRDQRRHPRRVHQLVLEAFVGPCLPGMMCCHNDGNPANNRAENLRWGTHKDNVADAIRHGTHLIGSASPKAKLKEDQVEEVLRLIEKGFSLDAIATRFGVDGSSISRIKRGVCWAEAMRRWRAERGCG